LLRVKRQPLQGKLEEGKLREEVTSAARAFDAWAVINQNTPSEKGASSVTSAGDGEGFRRVASGAYPSIVQA